MKDAKAKLPKDQEPGVVYAIGCQTCPGVYIGETARTATQRTKEHEMYIRHGQIEPSAIANHAHMHAHNIHWKPRVIAREENTHKRNVKEALALAIKEVTAQKGPEVEMNQDTGLIGSKMSLDLA